MDTKDFIYSFFIYLEKRFREKFLAQFPEESFGEPRVWDGINLHTFYELYGNQERELYIRGNVPASSPPEEIVISAKIISKQKRIEAAQYCSKYRQKDSLYTLTVEEIVLSVLGGKPWNVNEGFPFSPEGTSSFLEKILTTLTSL